MAEGFLHHFYNEKFEAYSAGITPTHVNSYAIKAMSEVCVDISNQLSKPLGRFGLDFGFDVVITTCSETEEACPVFPFGKTLHWQFPDPTKAKGTEEEIMDVFRKVRDSIQRRIDAAVRNREI